MKIKQGLSQEQSLKLHMSQELKQALALLQYNSMELERYIQELALDNPLIEIKEQSGLNVFYHRKISKRKSGDFSIMETASAAPYSLSDHLQEQLRLTGTNGSIAKGTRLLIDMLDENGYLDGDAENALCSTGLTAEEANRCIDVLQSLDPAGIGARSLQECLLLQMQRMTEKPKVAEAVIRDHFKLFAERSWKLLKKISGFSMEDIQDVFDFTLRLQPKPGSAFAGGQASYIIPDLIVERRETGIAAACNDEAVPQIRISRKYESLKNQHGQTELKKYLSAKEQQGTWLLKTMDHRKQTMVQIMKQIVAFQEAFFLSGKREMLKPLTLNDLAEASGFHESTVSRAIKGKYVQTPYGTLEMKSFLVNKIGSLQETEQSAAGAKEMLLRLVESEDKTSPLSDQMIASAMLERHDLKISRRTVAKYRDQLKIPPSSLRRRYTEAGND
ncbi:RNA polymerase factor sigma-54 [Bacillus sp. FJAT-42376]|uniref:RNA polymerase factor sigma-54 n=1 Tax=Bacillus sp. FJAT-42376 TaxID=2014076 RepID=UPI0013DDD136|nr:RNA polymerase factor sigma-54 [Bacillus sp. FJAT-42376]